jgi:hypothetical protein
MRISNWMQKFTEILLHIAVNYDTYWQKIRSNFRNFMCFLLCWPLQTRTRQKQAGSLMLRVLGSGRLRSLFLIAVNTCERQEQVGNPQYGNCGLLQIHINALFHP